MRLFKTVSVSLEIVVRLFFRSFASLNILPFVYIMKSKKVGVDYERKEKSFVCGQWGTEHFAT